MSFSSRNVNVKTTARNLPLNKLNVISLFEDDQDHQLLINPPLVAHLNHLNVSRVKLAKIQCYVLFFFNHSFFFEQTYKKNIEAEITQKIRTI